MFLNNYNNNCDDYIDINFVYILKNDFTHFNHKIITLSLDFPPFIFHSLKFLIFIDFSPRNNNKKNI